MGVNAGCNISYYLSKVTMQLILLSHPGCPHFKLHPSPGLPQASLHADEPFHANTCIHKHRTAFNLKRGSASIPTRRTPPPLQSRRITPGLSLCLFFVSHFYLFRQIFHTQTQTNPFSKWWGKKKKKKKALTSFFEFPLRTILKA